MDSLAQLLVLLVYKLKRLSQPFGFAHLEPHEFAVAPKMLSI
jgi:hypothetical protein